MPTTTSGPHPRIALIAAVARNRVIGQDNQIPWHLPEDLQHFKALTQGNPVLMGRKTWESLPPRFRPLPGRRNIVITRQENYAAPGAEVASSLPAALGLVGEGELACIIGGADIYTQALALADTLEITEVDLEPPGDAWFPAFSGKEWQETARQPAVSANGTGYAFVTYRRQGAPSAGLSTPAAGAAGTAPTSCSSSTRSTMR